MKLSDLIVVLVAKLAAEGEMNTYLGDMVPMSNVRIDVVDGDDVQEPNKYGIKYLNISNG
jgi:hypothetical protein